MHIEDLSTSVTALTVSRLRKGIRSIRCDSPATHLFREQQCTATTVAAKVLAPINGAVIVTLGRLPIAMRNCQLEVNGTVWVVPHSMVQHTVVRVY